jgi:hypothetical protein
MDEQNEQWVTVATCWNAQEALLLRSALEGHGLPVFMPDENISTVAPYHLTSTGVRLQVPSSKFEEAKAVVKDLRSEGSAEPGSATV